MIELIITDGSYFNTREQLEIKSIYSIPNCEYYLPTQNRCLLCKFGFLELAGSCILSSNCNTVDMQIPRCLDIKEECADELKLAPACTDCPAYFAKNSSGRCVPCTNHGCQSCTDVTLVCSSCDSSRNVDVPACTCPSLISYDDGYAPTCIIKKSFNYPLKIKYLPLDLEILNTPCTAANNQNFYAYNQLDGAEIATLGANTMAFSVWFKVNAVDAATDHNILRFSKSQIESDRCNAYLTVDIMASSTSQLSF